MARVSMSQQIFRAYYQEIKSLWFKNYPGSHFIFNECLEYTAHWNTFIFPVNGDFQTPETREHNKALGKDNYFCKVFLGQYTTPFLHGTKHMKLGQHKEDPQTDFGVYTVYTSQRMANGQRLISHTYADTHTHTNTHTHTHSQSVWWCPDC